MYSLDILCRVVVQVKRTVDVVVVVVVVHQGDVSAAICGVGWSKGTRPR